MYNKLSQNFLLKRDFGEMTVEFEVGNHYQELEEYTMQDNFTKLYAQYTSFVRLKMPCDHNYKIDQIVESVDFGYHKVSSSRLKERSDIRLQWSRDDEITFSDIVSLKFVQPIKINFKRYLNQKPLTI